MNLIARRRNGNYEREVIRHRQFKLLITLSRIREKLGILGTSLRRFR